MKESNIILGIETSCDDTSASICIDGKILSNVTQSQIIHKQFGGVVPELASRDHETYIIPVIQEAISSAEISVEQLDAIAVTRGPGLVGSLLVGICTAKSMAFGLDIPLIEVNHIQAHVVSNYINKSDIQFPFLCLTVSGGHTQIVYVSDYLDMEIVGSTIDDAAGEAFDKTGKMLGLDYPAGPIIDKKSKLGNPDKFTFAKPRVPDLNFSFSGLKTSVLYFLQKQEKENPDFIDENIDDLCASIQKTIIDILISKMKKGLEKYDVKGIAIAGGVSANSGLRKAFEELAKEKDLKLQIPDFQYCTDNAGMIAMAGYFKYLKGEFASLDMEPIVKNYSI